MGLWRISFVVDCTTTNVFLFPSQLLPQLSSAFSIHNPWSLVLFYPNSSPDNHPVARIFFPFQLYPGPRNSQNQHRDENRLETTPKVSQTKVIFRTRINIQLSGFSKLRSFPLSTMWTRFCPLHRVYWSHDCTMRRFNPENTFDCSYGGLYTTVSASAQTKSSCIRSWIVTISMTSARRASKRKKETKVLQRSSRHIYQ